MHIRTVEAYANPYVEVYVNLYVLVYVWGGVNTRERDAGVIARVSTRKYVREGGMGGGGRECTKSLI
jgi:hypothetical protein